MNKKVLSVMLAMGLSISSASCNAPTLGNSEITTTAIAKAETKKNTSKLFNKENVLWLSKIIEHEAGNVSEYTAYMVGVVVMKRVKSPLFPNTVKGVLLQDNPRQYMSEYEFSLVKPSKRSKKLARKLLKGGHKALRAYPDNLLYHANFVQGTVYRYSDTVYFCLQT